MALDQTPTISEMCAAGAGRARARIASETWAVVFLTLVAAGLRMAFLRDVLDFNADEACVGVYAQHILRGDARYFAGVTDYFGPLHTLLVALCLRLGGENVLAVRAASVLLGTALVPATYLLGREILGQRRAALAAAALSAVFPLHVALSRMAYSISLLPTVDALALLCLLRWYRTGGRRWAIRAGLLLGAGLQLHPAQYPVLVALAAEFVCCRRWRSARRTDALMVALLAGVQSPALLTPLLGALFGTAPELRYAVPAPGPSEGWTALTAARAALATAAGVECADLGARPGPPPFALLSALLLLVGMGWGIVARVRARRLSPDLCVLAAVAAFGALAVGRGFGEDAWRQRYFALMAPLVPLLVAGAVVRETGDGRPGTGERRETGDGGPESEGPTKCGRLVSARPAAAALAWALVGLLALCQVACVGRALLRQRGAPRPIAALAQDLPGIAEEKPWGILAENWWVFWPVRFLTADRLPVLSSEGHLSNHVKPGAGSELVWIGWLPDGSPSQWHPMRADSPERLQIRRGVVRGAPRR